MNFSQDNDPTSFLMSSGRSESPKNNYRPESLRSDRLKAELTNYENAIAEAEVENSSDSLDIKL